MPSMQFDTSGADARFSWGDLAAIPDSDVDFSVELWVRYTTLSASVYYVTIAKGISWIIYQHSVDTGGVATVVFDDVRAAPIGLTPSTNTWYYLCFVHSAAGNTVQGYYAARGDAALTVGTLTSSIAGPTTGAGAFIIGTNASSVDGIDGEIALARVWDKALSTAELQQLWDTHVVGKQFDNLVFNWDAAFDRGTGVTAADVADQVAGTAAVSTAGTPARSTQDPGLRIYGMPEAILVIRPQGAAPPATRPRMLTLLGVG